jgi:ribonuclease HI
MFNGKANATCGSRIWYGPDHRSNKALRIPGPAQSNQVGKLAAVIVAAETTPNFSIVTDSKYVIEGLTKHLPVWEDRGWIGIANADLFKRVAYILKSQMAPTSFKWVKGHNGMQGNEESDALAKTGALKNTPDELPLDIPEDFNLHGTKLSTLMQATAYKGITSQRTVTPRTATAQNLEKVRAAIEAFQGSHKMDKAIWLSMRKHTIHLRAQQFLYKVTHNTPMVGGVWANIPGYEERGICRTCNIMETMEHILVTCEADPVRTIWQLAKDTWPHNAIQWPDPNLGIILGSSCLSIPGEPQENNGNVRKTPTEACRATRLLQILVSEAAHLIWVLRCKRVIQELTHSRQEIKARWWKMVNRRLTDNKISASMIKRSKPFTLLMEATWGSVL